MDRLIKKNYVKKKPTKTWLYNHGFKHSKIISDEFVDAYTYRFPVYRYNMLILLECEILIFLQTGEVRLNVFDNNTRDVYAPFYCYEYGGKNSVLIQINNKIERELKKLGIKERIK